MFASVGFAELTEQDSEFGVASITHDSDTGLEWLDVDQSADMSVLDIEAGLEEGGAYFGWRYATPSEIEVLFYVSAGLSEIGTLNPDEAPLYVEALRLLGITFDTVMHGCIGCTQICAGINSQEVGENLRMRSTIAISWVNSNMREAESLSAVVYGVGDPVDQASFSVGHWLVRDSGSVPSGDVSWGSIKAQYR